jgi:hypothetical protein
MAYKESISKKKNRGCSEFMLKKNHI